MFPLRTLRKSLWALLALAPTAAHAHVRWFVNETQCPMCHFPMDATAALVIAGGVAFALACLALHCLGPAQAPAGLLSTRVEWRLLAMLTGVMLLANCATHVFLAPNLELPGTVPARLGMAAQFLAGVLLFSESAFSIAGLLIVATTIAAAFFIPPLALANYAFELLGLGVAMCLAGPLVSPANRRIVQALGLDPARATEFALPIVRIGMGLTLAILALDEKLLHPHLAAAFLATHHFNFMPALGFGGFTDLHFVLSAGVAELTFGILLIAGIATRAVTVTMSVFFILTMIALGPMEIFGHAPIFGVALLLVSRGGGRFQWPVPQRRTTGTLSQPALAEPASVG